MIARLLHILWFFMPFCWLIAGATAWPLAPAPLRWIFAAFFALGLSSWAYLTVRILGFRARLLHFLNQLLAGNYETGLCTRRHFADEISQLETLANRFAERLQTYDRLRADRVSLHARAFDLLLDRSAEPLAAIDVEQEVFLFNPAAQKALGIERKNFSFESVNRPDINSEFRDLFNDAVCGRKTCTDGFSWLQLPGMSEPVYIGVQFTPLRNKEEKVCFAVLSIKTPQRKPQHDPGRAAGH